MAGCASGSGVWVELERREAALADYRIDPPRFDPVAALPSTDEPAVKAETPYGK
jgi:hypothetical protein